MVKEGDTDIQDLLRGDAALLDAAKKGCLARVQKLCSPENINCRDTQGRNSTPLHLAGETGHQDIARGTYRRDPPSLTSVSKYQVLLTNNSVSYTCQKGQI